MSSGKRSFAKLTWTEEHLPDVDGVPQESELCAICHEPLDGETTATVMCGHVFHTACRTRHLQSRSMSNWTCPCCREQMFVGNAEQRQLTSGARTPWVEDSNARTPTSARRLQRAAFPPYNPALQAHHADVQLQPFVPIPAGCFVLDASFTGLEVCNHGVDGVLPLGPHTVAVTQASGQSPLDVARLFYRSFYRSGHRDNVPEFWMVEKALVSHAQPFTVLRFLRCLTEDFIPQPGATVTLIRPDSRISRRIYAECNAGRFYKVRPRGVNSDSTVVEWLQAAGLEYRSH